MKLNLVGQDYTSRSLAVAAQTCINLFPGVIDDPNDAGAQLVPSAPGLPPGPTSGKNKAVLFGVGGKHLFKDLTAAGPDVRGLLSGSGRLFAVAGNDLVEIDSGGSVISATALPSGYDDGLPAQMFGNGQQLLIIAGGKVYFDNGGGGGPQQAFTDNYAGTVTTVDVTVPITLHIVEWVSGDQFLTDGSWVGWPITINGVVYTITQVISPILLYVASAVGTQTGVAYSANGVPLTAVTGAYMNDTFFVQRPRNPNASPDLGRQVNFSAVFDGSSWSGLDFFQKSGYPDYIRGIGSDGINLYLWGDETFEVWNADPNAAVDANPFVEIIGAMGRFGNVSPYGNTCIGGRWYFVGADDHGWVSVYTLNGYTPVRISNHAQEAAWNSAGLGTNCVVYAYQEEGHTFVVINFGSQTWAYDPESGAWHQRYKWSGTAFEPYLTNLHTFIPEWGTGGMHITACTTGPPHLYQSSINFYDDEGTDICWQRALPYIYGAGFWQYFGRLDLMIEAGTDPAGVAVITRDYSDDDGVTFINPQSRSTGASGASTQRLFWLRNGKSRARIPRFTGIGQIKVVLIDAEWDVELGTT